MIVFVVVVVVVVVEDNTAIAMTIRSCFDDEKYNELRISFSNRDLKKKGIRNDIYLYDSNDSN